MNKGVPEDAVEITVGSLSEATLKQYGGGIKDWWQFTKDNGHDMLNANNTVVLEFLTKKFKEGASYGTLNSTRSAISLISTNSISSDPLISRFLRGVFKQRPTKPKYTNTWDTEIVLRYIESLQPYQSLKSQEIAEKTATLLALVSAHRLQTLALINLDNITVSSSTVEIKVPDIIKTSKPGSFQPNIILPFFKERPEVCAASAILDYLESTRDKR